MSRQELGIISPPEAIQMEVQTESSNKKWWKNPDNRARMKKIHKLWWQTDPRAIERKKELKKRWEKAQISEMMHKKGIKASPETRSKRRQIQTDLWQNLKYREKLKKSHRNWWENHPVEREALSETMMKQWQDPKYRARMLRAKEVRRNMREANPRLLTPTAPGDLENWAYARINDLIPEIIGTGRVKEEEIERLKAFFEVKGTNDRLPEDLLVRFSTAVAWVFYDPLD